MDRLYCQTKIIVSKSFIYQLMYNRAALKEY